MYEHNLTNYLLYIEHFFDGDVCYDKNLIEKIMKNEMSR